VLWGRAIKTPGWSADTPGVTPSKRSVITWHNGLRRIRFVVPVAVVALLVWALATSSGHQPATVVVFCVGMIALGVAVWRMLVYPSLSVTEQGIEVRNGIDSQSIDWDSVVSCKAGWGGIAIRTTSGDSPVAWAIQKTNLDRWRHRNVRADDISRWLMGLASMDPSERSASISAGPPASTRPTRLA